MIQVKKDKPADLEERCEQFAEQVISLLKRFPQNSVNERLVEQCVGSAGSIGANYCEAKEAESRKDFIHKLGISKKEIRETRHWLRLLATANVESADELRRLWKESNELLLIFSRSILTARK